MFLRKLLEKFWEKTVEAGNLHVYRKLKIHVSSHVYHGLLSTEWYRIPNTVRILQAFDTNCLHY